MSKPNDLKKYKKSGQSSPALKILTVLILIVALVGAGALYFKQEAEYERQLAKQARLMERYEQLTEENIALEAEIHSVGSDDYVKRIAKEVLGMVWPNQVIFRNGDESAEIKP